MTNRTRIIAAVYLEVAVFTFVGVAAKPYRPVPMTVRIEAGLIAAAFWPLYWSWELQS